jgi:hypothetical protein
LERDRDRRERDRRELIADLEYLGVGLELELELEDTGSLEALLAETLEWLMRSREHRRAE